MAAAVQPSIETLNHNLKSLNINNDYYGQKQGYKAYKKVNATENERKRLLFDTPYEPSQAWWASNQAEYTKPSDDPLPDGFPDKVTDPTVWDGKVLINERGCDDNNLR